MLCTPANYRLGLHKKDPGEVEHPQQQKPAVSLRGNQLEFKLEKVASYHLLSTGDGRQESIMVGWYNQRPGNLHEEAIR